jgi:hypothetical protein
MQCTGITAQQLLQLPLMVHDRELKRTNIFKRKSRAPMPSTPDGEPPNAETAETYDRKISYVLRAPMPSTSGMCAATKCCNGRSVQPQNQLRLARTHALHLWHVCSNQLCRNGDAGAHAAHLQQQQQQQQQQLFTIDNS